MAQFGGLTDQQRQDVIDYSLGIEILKKGPGRYTRKDLNLQIVLHEADSGLIIPAGMIDILAVGEERYIGNRGHYHN